MNHELTGREKDILRYIVQQFILTAAPVGSRNIARRYDLNYSPATVRNIMSDLEDSGYIGHPHTSAGRVPTDLGYRLYVDSLMELEDLNRDEKQVIADYIENTQLDNAELFSITSKLLSTITHQLGCVVYPNFDSGTLERLQLVYLSSTRLLIVLTIRSLLVKTITLEFNTEIQESQIPVVQSLLNERLGGLTLREIRTTFRERFSDYPPNLGAVMTVFLGSLEKIFGEPSAPGKAVISGTGNLLKKPEFDNSEKFQTIIEMIEEKDIIVHVFENTSEKAGNNVMVKIGGENEVPELEDFSLITKDYTIGDVTGSLGVVGPKRMEYAKIVAIVDYIGTMLTQILKNK